MNRTVSTFATITLAASATVFSGAALAQAASAPAGKTRAEVVAETRAALRNGEIRDGHEWAMYQPQPVARQQPLKLATTTAR